jgi:ketosteroid isomerase-like protein
MSEENVEIVLKNVEAINRGDVDAFVATVSPDVEWEDAMFYSEVSRTYRGKDELREWFHRVLEPWESFHVEVDEIREAEDWVLGGGVITARGRASSVETQLRGWLVFWVRDGMITKRQPFFDREVALEAAGLSE